MDSYVNEDKPRTILLQDEILLIEPEEYLKKLLDR